MPRHLEKSWPSIWRPTAGGWPSPSSPRPLPAGRGHPAPAPRSAGPTLLAHTDKRTAAACFSLESASDWGRAAPRAHARPGMEPTATRIPTLEAGGDAGCGLGQWGCAGPQRGPRPASGDAAPDQTKYNVGRAGSSQANSSHRGMAPQGGGGELQPWRRLGSRELQPRPPRVLAEMKAKAAPRLRRRLPITTAADYTKREGRRKGPRRFAGRHCERRKREEDD